MVGPYSPPARPPLRRPVPARRLLAALVLAAVAGISAACKDGPPTLSELPDVATLQARFNRDAGKPRVVLLLSPT